MTQDGCVDPQRQSESGDQGMKLNTSDRIINRRAYVRNSLPGNLDTFLAQLYLFIIRGYCAIWLVYRYKCDLPSSSVLIFD